MKTQRIIECSLLAAWLFFVAAAAVLVAIALTNLLFGQTRDIYEGFDPHDIPHCSPKGGPQSATCGCLGMVNDVREAQTLKCWEEAGMKNLKDIPEELRLLAPESVQKCLSKVLDHCEVIARTPFQLGYDGKNTCRTSCLPNRCGCSDSACKSHGEEGATY